MENASTAFLDAVRKSMRSIREAIGAMTVTPGLLTCAEKLQYEGYLRREETNAAIIKLVVRAFRSRRSFAARAIAGSSSGRSSAARGPMSSASGRARLKPIFPFWRSNGAQAAAAEPNSGGG